MKEEELAGYVVAWLKCQGWEVYQEVDRGRIADIVAVNGPVIWVIECKVNLCIDVLAQAFAWTEYAHLISVAVSRPRKNRRAGELWNRLFRDYGIGCLSVSRYIDEGRVEVSRQASIRRPRFVEELRASLDERQKDYAPAGSVNGKRYTPFRRTCDAVVELVKRNPGLTFKELLKDLSHHYASDTSARISLRHWIDQGVIAGIELRKEGRELRLFPK